MDSLYSIALHYPKKLSKITSSTILGHIKTDYGVYTCQFDIEEGIKFQKIFLTNVEGSMVLEKQTIHKDL